MTRRLFIALEPPDSVRGAVASIHESLGRMRWISPENFHLTLVFLGDVDADSQQALEEALAVVTVKRFLIGLSGVGTFGRGRPRVVWAGVSNTHPHLFALRKNILDAALSADIEADMRSFTPHLTIARCSGTSPESLKPFLKEHQTTDFGIMSVSTFALFETVAGPSGSEYVVLNRWNLAD